MSCPVCGGSGFVKAAPLSMVPKAPIYGRGPHVAVIGGNMRRRALWSKALIVPCFGCSQAPVMSDA